MSKYLAFIFAFTLLTDADFPRVTSLRSPEKPVNSLPLEAELPLFPTVAEYQGGSPSGAKTPGVPRTGPLSETSKLELIRYVSGEFAKAIKSLPAGKEGFTLAIGKPFNAEFLDRAVATHGAAVNTGDSVQITKLEFRDHQIVVDLNGGGRGRKHWRDHIQIGFGGGYPTARTTTTQDTGPPGLQPGMGSTLFLEFGKNVPDMSSEDLKKLLSTFLNFEKERSASVQWFDTLPPEMKKAIQDRTPVVGMDREEVIAAIGKPEHKVRERDADGNEIEDWIYGQPPSKTIFVRFTGERVTSIKQFPQ
jgi:hypothetical protein